MSGNFVPDPASEAFCINCLTERGKRVKIYKIAEDKLEIGPAPLDLIWYHFYEGRLCGIQIQFDGEHWYELEDLFFRIYGEQKDDFADGKKNWHKWLGKNIYIKLWKLSKFDMASKCFIEYCYLPIKKEDSERYQLEMAQWRKEQDRKIAEEERKEELLAKKTAKEDL